MSKLAKATIGLMLVTILSKVLGFAREQILSYVYGISDIADAYISASNIPTIVFASIGSAIATTLIPMYSSIKEESGEEEATKFTSNLINIVIILCSIISLFILIFTQPVVNIFAIGFTGEKLELTVRFTKILCMGMIFIGGNHVLVGYLQIKGNFIIPGLIGIPYSIIVMLSIIMSSKINVDIIAYGTLFAMGIQILFLLPFVYKNGYKHNFSASVRDKNVRKLIILVLPVLIGVGVNQINTIVDRTLGSTLGSGTVAVFSYANKLYGFVAALFVTSIIAVVYPKMSSLAGKNDTDKLKEIIPTTMNTITLLITPICAGTIVLGTPIVKILFERGAFDHNATIMTSNVLKIYMIGMLAFGLRDAISRVFYSLKDTKSPMINGAIAIVFNIILNLILIKPMGYIGLAVASTISAYIGVVLFYISLRKKTGGFNDKSIISAIVKSFLASLIMSIIILFVYSGAISFIGKSLLGEIISVSISVILGTTIYSIVIILLKVDEVKIIIKQAMNLKKRLIGK